MGAVSDDFQIFPEIVVPLKTIAARAQTELAAFDATSGRRLSARVISAEVYQTGDNLAVALHIKRRSITHPAVTLYLTGRPVYNAQTQVIFLSDLQFEPDSRAVIRRWGSSDLAKAIEAHMSKSMRFTLQRRITAAFDRLQNLNCKSDQDEFIVRTNTIDTPHAWLQDDALHVMLATGGGAAMFINSETLAAHVQGGDGLASDKASRERRLICR